MNDSQKCSVCDDPGERLTDDGQRLCFAHDTLRSRLGLAYLDHGCGDPECGATPLLQEVLRLEQLINNPHTDSFLEAVRLEAAHQRERWGTVDDAGKQAPDWFWLLGYLAGKALNAAIKGHTDKALHHTISTAAVCLNWHAHITGASTEFQPGIDTPEGGEHGDS